MGALIVLLRKYSTASQGQEFLPEKRAGFARRARADIRPERWGMLCSGGEEEEERELWKGEVNGRESRVKTSPERRMGT